jgi:NAD(P)H-hydrate epimerase
LVPNQATKKIVKNILTKYPNKKIIIDAGALRVLNLDWLHKNCVVTPHAGEFKFLFKKKDTQENVLIISKKYPAIIVAKGAIDYIAQNGQLWISSTGNAGMTKGGTGDVLSGLLSALATKNDLLTATQTAVYVNGLAGDRLKKRFHHYYSASELIEEARRVLGGR